MYVINNFSNQHYSSLTDVDKLIWLMSLINYKKLGYKTKLYCEKSDIQFLKNTCLYYYYDEIDTETLANALIFREINNKEFWFWRKIVAMENEFNLEHDFFYSDTDIILMKKPDFSDCDLYVWWLEDRDIENWAKRATVYWDWKDFSWPKDYIMPEYIKNTGRDNYNCGLLYFKDKEVFELWKAEMLKFIIGNPCEIYNEKITDSGAIFACNTEQRMLKGVANYLNLRVKAFDTQIRSNGMAPGGVHFFFWRLNWRRMKNILANNNLLWSTPEKEEAIQTLLVLTDFVNMWMNQLKQENLLLEWTRNANNEYIYKLIELNNTLEYLFKNYE